MGGGANGGASVATPNFSNLDVLDIFGTKAAKRDAQTEKMIGSQTNQMNAFMASQPKYAAISKNGQLDPKYALKAPAQAKASLVDTKQLDKRMAGAKDVNIDDVAYTGNIGPGENYAAAQGNIDALQQRAFGTDTSPWAQKLYDQQALQESGALDQLGHEGALAQNQQLNSLAMQGGLEGGSRERLAKASSRDQMMARQGVFRQGQMDKLGIGINDEAQRMQLQQQMPGMNMQMDQYQTGLQQADRDVMNQIAFGNQGKDMTQQQFNTNLAMNKANEWAGVAGANANLLTNTNQFNTGAKNQVAQFNQQALLGDVQGKNAYDLGSWQTKGSVLGNSQTANAQARQGSGQGGFFQKLLG